jgi:hypothetical protein
MTALRLYGDNKYHIKDISIKIGISFYHGLTYIPKTTRGRR